MSYDLVLFDVDDTLLDFGRARDHALGSALRRFARDQDHPRMTARFHVINTALWKQLERAEVTKDEVLEGRFTRLFAEFGVPADAREINEHFLAELAAEPFLIDGATELVEGLSPRFTLGVVTNGHAPTQRKRLKSAGIAHHFAFAVVSDEVGEAKPHPKIFEHALAKASVARGARVLMIGDNLDADIRGAQAMGFDTCWFRRPGIAEAAAPNPTYTVARLSEIGSLPCLRGRTSSNGGTRPGNPK